MADISKITLPSGTTYNIKDTVSGYLKPTDWIQGGKVIGGFNIGNTSNFVSINPAFNFNAFAIEQGADLQVFLDGVELTGIPTNIKASYFDGTSACPWQPFLLTNQTRYTSYSTTTTYAIGELCKYRPSGATKDMWYRCIKESTGHLPTDATYWEDVSAPPNYDGVDPTKFSTLTYLVTNLPFNLAWEVGLSLYWRAGNQNPKYVTVTKIDTSGNRAELGQKTLNRTSPDSIFLGGVSNNANQKSIELVFSGFEHNNQWAFALSQIAFTGLTGSIDKAVMMRSGGKFYGSFQPYNNNAYDIGDSTHKWRTIYANTFAGNASSASKLNTNAGSATQPIYFENGVPKATSYTVSKSVPSDAKFTDTTYQSLPAAVDGTDVSLVTTGEKYLWNSAASGGVSSVNGRTGAVVVVPVLSNTRPTGIYTGETWYKIV